MKRFLCVIFSLSLMLSLSLPVSAASTEHTTNPQLQISRTALDQIRGDTPALTQSQAKQAINLIDELAYNIQLSNEPALQANAAMQSTRAAKINSIEQQLDQLGVITLTIEDIYELHGRTYRPGAPETPGNLNYVHFSGFTTYVGNYEVWSIKAWSAGKPQSALIPPPMFKDGEVTVFDNEAYIKSDFSGILDIGASVGSFLFEDAFEKVPILNYLSTVWDVATYFNPVATQEVTVDYAAQQTFIYSYVADRDVGYFDFVQTTERIAGYFIIKFAQYTDATPRVKQLEALNWEATSPHYEDYENAVSLYQDMLLQNAYTVGEIEFSVGNQIKDSFSMYYYNSIWNIPGV